MHGQWRFQTFGLCLSQLLASMQYLLHSAQFASALLCMFKGPGAVLIQQYTLSVYVLVYHVPVLCLPFCSVGFLSLRIAVLGVSSPQPQLQGLFCRVYFSKLSLQHWVGQLCVLASWGVTVVAAPGPLGHLASICDVGVNLILSYLFGIFRQAGSVWLLKAGLNVGLYK